MRKTLSEQKCEILEFSENLQKQDHCKECAIVRANSLVRDDNL